MKTGTVVWRTPDGTPRREGLAFDLVNLIGMTVVELYLSGSDDDAWGDDLLGPEVLSPGQMVRVEASSGVTTQWDLRVVADDDSEIAWRGLDLGRVSRIVLRDGKTVPAAELE